MINDMDELEGPTRKFAKLFVVGITVGGDYAISESRNVVLNACKTFINE